VPGNLNPFNISITISTQQDRSQVQTDVEVTQSVLDIH